MASGDLGDLVSGVGGAVSDLFKSQGNSAQATDFQGAATLAEQNAQLSAASTRIQEAQTSRTVAQSLGTTQADIAGAGFTNSGSALDILKSSAQQGALAKSLVNIQGAINENSYAAQAGAYTGEAKAAQEASTAGTVGAIASIGGALISGAGTLASAGKTVVQGYNTISNLFSSTPTASTAGGSLEGPFQATGEAYGPALQSATDESISNGASVGVDTSGLSIGDTASQVSSAVGDAFDSASSAVSDVGASIFGSAVGDIIPGLGIADILGSIPAIQDIPVVGPVLGAISSGVNDVVDGVVNVVSDVGSAIGGFFGSVICTALYKRGMLTRSVWHGAQVYGRDVAPEHVYFAYLLWGRPIAQMISRHAWFARIAAPVFVPWAHELAVLSGEKTAKSTARGRMIFAVTYAFSWALGKMFYKGEKYVEA